MPSMQEALAAAFDEHAQEGGEITNEKEPPARDIRLDTKIEDAAVIEEPASGRVRSSDGKFAPKAKPADDEIPTDQQQNEKKVIKESLKLPDQQAAALPPAPQAIKAPVSWRPEVREKFGALPPEVQAEVNRREREVEAGMREASESRRFHGEFANAVRPYEAMIRAEGGTPVQAAAQLFGTAYMLRTGSPPQKAQLVAQMIQAFGIDVTVLDDILSKNMTEIGSAQAQDTSLAYIQKELAPIKQFMGQLTGMQTNVANRRQQDAQAEIDAFVNDPKNEFYEDVKDDIATLLELAAQRNQKMTLQDAYQRATMLHPSISDIIANRRIETQAQRQTAAARRSRDASASIPSGGAPEQQQGVTKPKDLRSAIEAAWDTAEQRSGS